MPQRTTTTTEPKPAPTRLRRSTCVHRWVLGDPDGGVIRGQCRNCNAKRVYSTTPEGNDRFDDYREITAASSYHWSRSERKSA